MIKPSSAFDALLPKRFERCQTAEAFAPSNIALSKYWGKRNRPHNLPTNSSLSISLGKLGTHTRIEPASRDVLLLNGAEIDPQSPNQSQSALFSRTFDFVNQFRRGQDFPLLISTVNNIPTAAGLASSASGFAALCKALCGAFALDLDDKALSVLARLGSGSACRSLWQGFVHWQVGTRDDGLDSHGIPIESDWQDLRLAVVLISTQAKALSSTQGMNQTVATSPLYANWAKTAEADVATLRHAIDTQDFDFLGKTSEANALAMHATMLAARPAVWYVLPESVAVWQVVWALRAQGLALYFTMDAGANVKLLYRAQDQTTVQNALQSALSAHEILWVNPWQS